MISRLHHLLKTCLLNRSLPDKLSLFLFILFLVYSTFALSLQEVQPFDEGYYALRAAAIAAKPTQLSLWISQESFSIKGFYSASHPPLMIWLMAISIWLIGESEFALRLPMWLCFIGSAYFLAQLIILSSPKEERHKIPDLLGWSLLLYCLTPFAYWYGRMAMLESGVLLFSISQVYFFLRYIKRKSFTDLIFSGVCLGLGLLSKSLVCLLTAGSILIFFALYREDSVRNKKRLDELATFFSIGIVIGSVWLLINHYYDPSFLSRFFKHYFSERLLTNQTEAVQQSGYLYYANMLAVRFPLSILSLYWIICLLKEPRLRTPFRKFLLVWFLIPFLVLSLGSTKLLWYGLLFFPPLVILTSESVVWLNEQKNLGWALLLILPVLLWSFAQPIAALTSFASLKILLQTNVVYGGVGSLAFVLAIFVAIQLRNAPLRSASIRLVLLVTLMIWGYDTNQNGLSLVRLFGGMKEITEVIRKEKKEKIIFITEERKISAQGGINPQRTYYWRGNDSAQCLIPLPDAMQFRCRTVSIESITFLGGVSYLLQDTTHLKPFALIVEYPSPEEMRYGRKSFVSFFEILNTDLQQRTQKRHLRLQSYDLYY